MTIRDLTILGCSSQQPTRHRNHGAYLIRWNGEGLLFDPGEGTQRQFIFADVAPTCVKRIFVSHFHGDHCLGLGSMLMRLNLDNVTHEIHVYYPASGKRYFDRLRYGTIYHERINVVEHPVSADGLVEENESFRIEAYALDHGVENYAWRIKEHDTRKFDAKKLKERGVCGPLVGKLQEEGEVIVDGALVHLDDVSVVREGEVVAYIVDTRMKDNLPLIAKNARLLICESTYLDAEKKMAHKHRHLTATQAAQIASDANVEELVLTHFSARHVDSQVFANEARVLFPNVHAAEDLKKIPFPKKK